MAKIFDVDFRKGSLIDSVSGKAGNDTYAYFKKFSKGKNLNISSGSNYGCYINNSEDINLIGDFTIILWFRIKTPELTSGVSPIFSKHYSPGWLISFNNTNNAITIYFNGGGGAAIDTLFITKNNTDYFLSIKREGSIIKFKYNDNTWETSTIVNGDSASNTIKIAIGNILGIYGFQHRDSFSVYRASLFDEALSDSVVNKLYNEFLNSTVIQPDIRNFVYSKPIDLSNEPNLVVAYNMTPINNKLIDISSNNNDLDIYGAISRKDGLYFDGVDDYCGATNSVLDGYTKATICVKIDRESDFVTYNYFVSNYTDSNNRTHISYNDVLKRIIFNISNSSSNYGYVDIDKGEFEDIVMIFDGTQSGNENRLRVFVDGVEQTLAYSGTIPSSLSTGTFSIGKQGTTFSSATIEDIRIYNDAISDEKAIAYHNSFAKQISMNESFEEEAMNNTKLLNWTQYTGAHKVDEYVLRSGELVSNGNFNSITDWFISNGGWAITGGQAVCDGTQPSYSNLYQNIVFKAGHKYKITVDVDSVTTGDLQIVCGSSAYTYVISAAGTYEFERINAGSATLYIHANFGFIGALNSISIIELPIIQGVKTGTKFLRNTSDGLIYTPSTQVYGTWEFTFQSNNKLTGVLLFYLMSDRLGTVNTTQGYILQVHHAQKYVRILRNDIGSHLIVPMASKTGYIEDYVTYGIKVTRSPKGEWTTYIRGGTFGDNYVLLDTTGGSGTNPATENTYTESKYMMIDNDNMDMVFNIKMKNGIET